MYWWWPGNSGNHRSFINKMSFKCISIKKAKSLIEKDDLILIDIRDYNSFSKGHIENAIHV